MIHRITLLLAIATLATAQYGPDSGYGFGGNGDGNGNGNGRGGNNDGDNDFGRGQYGGFGRGSRSRAFSIITAHAVLASLAFVLFFPLGGILIRLGSFRGVWVAHAGVQALGWIFYLAAFGIGVWMTANYYTFNRAHPIIGIVLFVLLAFQPILGLLHHIMFKKHTRRVIWSHGHIWLGRIIVVLGIINGGLGLRLAKRERFMAPSKGAVIGYSVAAAVMGLLYLASILIGERRRSKAIRSNPPPYKETRDEDWHVRESHSHEMSATRPSSEHVGAPGVAREYYKPSGNGEQ